MRKLLTLLFFIITSISTAQINSFEVAPVETDSNYEEDQNNHLVVRNSVTQSNKLFLFIGGTFSDPSLYQSISSFAAGLGFDAISLSYKNNVAATFFANFENEIIFDNYRQHLCYGTPLTFVQVDTLNSINVRTIKLLEYLHDTYPTQNWDQYLESDNTLNWSKIVVGGHSQGAGHACYFGKFEPVDRVLMFAGPNDYSKHFESPANWLSIPGVTPIERHFSYLHLFDNVVDFDFQFSNIGALGLYPLYDSTSVETTPPPFNNSRCLYLQDTSGLISEHGKPIASTDLNKSVWEYMLSSSIMTDVNEIEENNISVYPNPTHSTVNVFSNRSVMNQSYTIFDIHGRLILNGNFNSNGYKIDLSAFPSGIYVLKIGRQICKIYKISEQ